MTNKSNCYKSLYKLLVVGNILLCEENINKTKLFLNLKRLWAINLIVKHIYLVSFKSEIYV